MDGSICQVWTCAPLLYLGALPYLRPIDVVCLFSKSHWDLFSEKPWFWFFLLSGTAHQMRKQLDHSFAVGVCLAQSKGYIDKPLLFVFHGFQLPLVLSPYFSKIVDLGEIGTGVSWVQTLLFSQVSVWLGVIGILRSICSMLMSCDDLLWAMHCVHVVHRVKKK